ncbi:hypothetical protein P5V15_007617 [Pogonomyrmex californicus]
MAKPILPCTYEFSRGYGTGAAEALGNWGFSNRICSSGQELQRLKCLFAEMDSLRSPNKPIMCVKYDPRYDPESWYVKPSECKPAWTFPKKRPLITYCSTVTILKIANLREIRWDPGYPNRRHIEQGTNKWYRRRPDCCYQPICLVP